MVLEWLRMSLLSIQIASIALPVFWLLTSGSCAQILIFFTQSYHTYVFYMYMFYTVHCRSCKMCYYSTTSICFIANLFFYVLCLYSAVLLLSRIACLFECVVSMLCMSCPQLNLSIVTFQGSLIHLY